MRRTDREFKAEVYRRRDEYKAKQKKRRKMLTTICCVVICFTGLTALFPTLFGGNSAKSADCAAPQEVMDMEMNGSAIGSNGTSSHSTTYGTPEGVDEPAEGQPTGITAEGGLSYDGKESALSRLYDIISIEVTTRPESEENERCFTDEEKIVPIINALESFYMFGSADGGSVEATGMSYVITVTTERGTEQYTLFSNALYSEKDGGWVPIDTESYEKLKQLITQEGD